MHTDRRAAVGPLRAAVAGTVVVGLAGAGHLVAGGAAPSLRALLLGTLLVALLCAAVSAQKVSAARLTAVLGGGQVVLHHAFSWVPGGHVTAAPGDVAEQHALWSDPTMLAAHALATVCAAVALRRGEAALVALGSWAGPLLVLVVAVPPAGGVRSLFEDVEATALGARRPAADPVRGPPRSLALAA